MTSQMSSQSSQRLDAENMKAARIYVENYPLHAMHFLCHHNPHQLLQTACAAQRHNYWKVMSEASSPEEDTKSISSSHHRTLSIDSGPANESSSSVIMSSSSSVDSASEILYVIPDTGFTDVKTLRAARLPQSNYLIRTDIVRSRLKLKFQSSDADARYKDGPILSCGTIALHWAWNSNDLDLENVQPNTFYVVNDLPGAEGVIGDLDDISMDQGGGLKAYSTSPPKKSPAAMRHSSTSLVGRQPTNTYTANSTNSTSSTMRTITGTAGQSLSERKQPSNSRRMSSASSPGSAPMSQSRAQSGQQAQNTPIPPPQTDQADELRVTIIWGESQFGSVRFQLVAPGGGRFYEQLNQHMKKRKAARELDRGSDWVRFSPHREVRGPFCCLSLTEEEIEESWEEAVQWLRQLKTTHSIYAIVEQDDG